MENILWLYVLACVYKISICKFLITV
jgi:hypothetical protein